MSAAREERYYAVLLKDGTADWRYARPGERVADAIAGSWRRSLTEAQEFVRLHNLAVRERARRAADSAPSLF